MLKQNSKTSLSLAILLATTMAGSAAHAADQGLFAEVGAGLSTIDVPSFNVPGVSVDDEDVFFSIGGGYNFNKMFAVEAGYTDLGEVSISNIFGDYATISADGWYFGPRLTVELSPQIEGYARIGMLAWESTLTSNVGFSGTDDGTDIYFGIGAAFKVSNQLSLGADWTRYTMESDGDDVDVDTFGGKLKFSL